MEAIRIEYEKEFQKSLDEDVRICLQFCFSYLVAVYAKQLCTSSANSLKMHSLTCFSMLAFLVALQKWLFIYIMDKG